MPVVALLAMMALLTYALELQKACIFFQAYFLRGLQC